MVESELKDLEAQIDKLIEIARKLKLENSSLHKKIAALNSENVALLDKKNQAAVAIKALIARLGDEMSF